MSAMSRMEACGRHACTGLRVDSPDIRAAEMEHIASTGGGAGATFRDAHGRICMVKVNSRRDWDLFIDGKQKVQNVSSFSARHNKLHFEGQRLFFSEDSLQVDGDATEVMGKIAALRGVDPDLKPLVLLQSGDIKILDAEWLLQKPSDYIMQRCQDLPAEAFVEPPAAAHLYLGKKLVVLSYPWLSKQHPDPGGFHFRLIQAYLAKHRDFCLFDPFGVFWDFASLPQPGPDGNRTAEEQQMFKRGLGGINYLYGSRHTVVVQLKSVPADTKFGLNITPYEQRGWCLFEQLISNILKPSGSILNLGTQDAQDMLAREGSSWSDVQRSAASAHRPPLHPDAMRALLEKAIFTGGEVDRVLVTVKYEEFFYHAATSARRLLCSNFGSGGAWDDRSERRASGGWSDLDLMKLSVALPAYINLDSVYLRFHDFTDSGLHMVLAALSKLVHLRLLDLTGSRRVSGVCFQALALLHVPSLLSLRLVETGLNDEGLFTLAQNLACFGNLKELAFARCMEVGIRGISALARQLPEGLEVLSFGRSSLDDRGLSALVERLAPLKQLRRLDFRGCDGISMSGIAALRHVLPQMAAMDDVQASTTCTSCGQGLDPYHVGVDAPFICFCSRCYERLPKGAVVYFHCDLNAMCCSGCLHGSLFLPESLQGSPESDLLEDAWVAGNRYRNRDKRQLRWC